MKKMFITTRAKANKMLVESLFVPVNGRTLVRQRYDLGKYKPSSVYTGDEVEVLDNVVAIWAETRKDEDGPYKALFCLTADRA